MTPEQLHALKKLVASLDGQMINPLTPRMRQTINQIMEIINNATTA